MSIRNLIPILLFSSLGCLADWPQFLGPTRDGVVPDASAVATQWPKEGPHRVWTREVGQGFSGPIVLGSRVFLFHRVGDEDVLECFEGTTGKTLWKSSGPARYVDDFGFDEGPRATPAADKDRVITVSADGVVESRDTGSGKKQWTVDGKTAWGARKGFFGIAPSPLLWNGKVVLNLGGSDGSSILALDATHGSVLWKMGDDEASYASPILKSIQGQETLVVLTREALVLADPVNGHIKTRKSWRPAMHASVSAATPLVVENMIFLSASYGAGASLLEVQPSGLDVRWTSQNALSSHFATPVISNGYLYGFDGRQEQGCAFRCVALETGKVMWEEARFGAGSVLLMGDRLLILSEKGELILAEASSKAFRPLQRAQILPFLARALPALSKGQFYARCKDKLFAFDLTSATPAH